MIKTDQTYPIQEETFQEDIPMTDLVAPHLEPGSRFQSVVDQPEQQVVVQVTPEMVAVAVSLWVLETILRITLCKICFIHTFTLYNFLPPKLSRLCDLVGMSGKTADNRTGAWLKGSKGLNAQLPSVPHVPIAHLQSARPSLASSHVCPKPWMALSARETVTPSPWKRFLYHDSWWFVMLQDLTRWKKWRRQTTSSW